MHGTLLKYHEVMLQIINNSTVFVFHCNQKVIMIRDGPDIRLIYIFGIRLNIEFRVRRSGYLRIISIWPNLAYIKLNIRALPDIRSIRKPKEVFKRKEYCLLRLPSSPTRPCPAPKDTQFSLCITVLYIFVHYFLFFCTGTFFSQICQSMHQRLFIYGYSP